MKKFLLILAITCQLSGFAQKMFTRSGVIKFEATMPAFEEIAATNNTVSCVFDKSNGDIAALALMKAFKFKSPLMEEHFNENYVESSIHPKATYKGKVIGFDMSKFSGGKATFDTEGDLTIHGVTKKVKTKIVFMISGDKLVAKCNFSIKPQDYNIEIPSVVKSKIAENIKIDVNFTLENK